MSFYYDQLNSTYGVNGEMRRRYNRGYDDGIEATTDFWTCRYYPKRIIQNGPATIIFWADGEKTVVKRKRGDKNDTDAAVAQAIAKRMYATNSGFRNVVKRALSWEDAK